MPPTRTRRWYARVYWGGEEEPAISPVLPWKFLKSYLDGVLTQRPLTIAQIVIRPAGEGAGHSPDSGAESE